MKLQNLFVQSKLNKDIDERLLPKGQYPHAENVRVANTDGSDAGAIENVKGNEALTNLNLTNAKTIGAYTDGSNQKVYWFVTSEEKDIVMEYDTVNSQISTLLESSNPDSVLNFDKNFLITGINKIINGDSKRDLLAWTDDLNPPRIINIERSKTYGADGFTSVDISLVKAPPVNSPEIKFVFDSTSSLDSIKDKFLAFSYRYKYLDGEYSALSSFTNYAFSPTELDLDFGTLENKGMVNNFNALDLKLDSGGRNVSEVELVFKESGSNNIYRVESFNKELLDVSDNSAIDYRFINNKTYGVLPEDELFRTYDNVPKVAKAQEVIGNRLVFGNYTEGFDLVDRFGQSINLDYEVSLNSSELAEIDLVPTYPSGNITIDISTIELVQNTSISFDITLRGISPNDDGVFQKQIDFILNRDYVNPSDLFTSDEFKEFIEDILTSSFNLEQSSTPPINAQGNTVTPFSYTFTSTTFTIVPPIVQYSVDNTPLDLNDNDFSTIDYNWEFIEEETRVTYNNFSSRSSVKTNRSYEVGIIYLDEYNRASTVLTSLDNTLSVPQSASENQNKIEVQLNNTPPEEAVRYKFAIKQNRASYYNIFAITFFEEDQFVWVKLEGLDKDKVQAGDTLYVKSDSAGVVTSPVEVTVLEVSSKTRDFIENNGFDQTTGEIVEGGTPIIEPEGVYMKIKPVGFNLSYNALTFFDQNYFGDSDDNMALFNASPKREGNDFAIKENSIVKIDLSGNMERTSRNTDFTGEYLASRDYDNFRDFYVAEVGVGEIRVSNSDFFFITQDVGGDTIRFIWSEDGGGKRRTASINGRIQIRNTNNLTVFETKPEVTNSEIFYETSQVFDIEEGYHQGNVQNQTDSQGVIVDLDWYNTFVMGGGVESISYLDGFNKPTLNIDLRPSSVSLEEFREVRRYADLTYSSVYNENNNINGLNEFNLSTANFKEDIDKRYGFIQKLFSRDTNIVVFQEDKVSKVLFGKDLLMNADGTSNISSIEDVLGQQIAYTGEFGISRNPESFAFDGFFIYFTDAKRGSVMRLGNNGLTEISKIGMTNYFRSLYKNSVNTRKFGAFDPFFDQYVLHNSTEEVSVPLNIECGQSITRSNFEGDLVLNIDYGLQIGEMEINLTADTTPVDYLLEWNGNVVSGNTSDGTIVLNKTLSFPRIVTLTITSSDCDNEIGITPVCIPTDDIKVVSIILNGQEDEGDILKSRYTWSNSSFVNSYKTYNSVFTDQEVNTFDINSGQEGSNFRPLTGSTIKLESYKGITQTGDFSGCNRLGYLISNVEYTEVQLANILLQATFPTVSTEVANSGDISNFITFDFIRPSSEQFLYLIWDYIDTQPTVEDDFISTQKGTSVTYDVRQNDTDPQGLPFSVSIVNQPSNGTVVVNPNGSITYTHDDSETTSDSFTYVANNGQCDSEEATVFIDIAVSCDESFSFSGNQGVFEFNLSFGTGTGTVGINYEAFGIPDQFEIFYDGNLVATTGGLVSGNGTLTFEKTQALPTSATVRVTATQGGTAWNMSGICPVDNSNNGNTGGTGGIGIVPDGGNLG